MNGENNIMTKVTLNITIKDENDKIIKNAERTLSCEFSKELQEDLKKFHKIDAEDEVNTILIYELQKEIPFMVKQLRNNKTGEK